MEILKKDIEILNFILNESLTSKEITLDILLKNKNTPFESVDSNNFNFGYKIADDFNRLAKIIRHYNAANYAEFISGDLINKNKNTYFFIQNGGFKKIYEEQLRLIEKENIEFEKSKVDLDLARRMIKDYRITKYIAVVSFIIGVILTVIQLYDLIK